RNRDLRELRRGLRLVLGAAAAALLELLAAAAGARVVALDAVLGGEGARLVAGARPSGGDRRDARVQGREVQPPARTLGLLAVLVRRHRERRGGRARGGLLLRRE